MRAQRFKRGSVRYDKRRGTWNYLWYDGGKRRSKLIGTKREYPTKTAAWKAVKIEPNTLEDPKLTVKTLIEHYRKEKMPQRKDTRRSYEVWLRCYILPKWGECSLAKVEARPVELWLGTLTLSSKSKSHIRGLLSVLWDYAMWRGDMSAQRNPMELVTVKGSTKRTRKPKSLTVEQFRSFAQNLMEPFCTIALLCVWVFASVRLSPFAGQTWIGSTASFPSKGASSVKKWTK